MGASHTSSVCVCQISQITADAAVERCKEQVQWKRSYKVCNIPAAVLRDAVSILQYFSNGDVKKTPSLGLFEGRLKYKFFNFVELQLSRDCGAAGNSSKGKPTQGGLSLIYAAGNSMKI